MAKRSSRGPWILAVAALSCFSYVACGDDDTVTPVPGGGGSGGSGGSGTGGSAGESSTAGTAGTGETGGGGAGGEAGTAGGAGAAGSAGAPTIDAGSDAATDSGSSSNN
jgi:hypothetical protein